MPIPLLCRPSNSQRVHVGIWYILRAQRGSHIPTLRPKYTPYSYMDPLRLDLLSARSRTDYLQCRMRARSSVASEAQKKLWQMPHIRSLQIIPNSGHRSLNIKTLSTSTFGIAYTCWGLGFLIPPQNGAFCSASQGHTGVGFTLLIAFPLILI